MRNDLAATTQPVAVWRAFQEPDRSWTITDDLRPGFIATGHYLGDAVDELMPAMARWDEENENV